MTNLEIAKLQDKIKSNITKSDHIFKFIHHFQFSIESCQLTNDSRGAHVVSSNGNLSYEEFWTEIRNALSNIVYGDKVQEQVSQLSDKKESSAAHTELFYSARKHFIHSNNQGKIGEVLLYFMIERLFGAVRIGSKFQLSTPREQQKGSDAIHLGITNKDGQLVPCFYLGEAKFYTDFHDGISRSLDSLASHREDNVFKEELKWLKGTPAAHNSFKEYMENIGTYDYDIAQVAFIILKDTTLIPSENQDDIHKFLKDKIQGQLKNEVGKTSFKDKFLEHPNKNEVHFIVFLLAQGGVAFEKFADIFDAELTPPNSGKTESKK